MQTDTALTELARKAPQITLLFWIVKIAATTLGETAGDAMSMTLDLGYAVSTLIFLGVFAVLLAAQIAARRYHPALYWAVVIATTTVGTTTSDFLDRSVGLGYVFSSILLFGLVLVVLAIWRASTGAIRANDIYDRRNEAFYWLTILVSNTLGTALGDFAADDAGLGFTGGALVFAGLIALVAAAWRWTRAPHALLFWAAYVLTRPLGATLGDMLTKPYDHGGFALDRFGASAVLLAIMAVGVLVMSRRVEPASA